MMRNFWQFLFLSGASLSLGCASDGDSGPDKDSPQTQVCTAPYSECGGICTDVAGDGKNCGACGVSCAEGQVCSSGVCQASCTEPGRTRCENSCIDVQTNPSHCGGCGLVCNGGQTCQAGACVATTGSGGADGTGGGAPGTGGAGTGGSHSTEVVIQEGEVGQCAVDGVLETKNAGFGGSGYLNVDAGIGSSVEWGVEVGEAGTYALEIAYANQSADRPADLLVDGVVASPGVSFASTASWSTWSTVSANVTLAAGQHRIVLRATDAAGLANIDSLKVTGAAVSALACTGGSGTGGDGSGGGGTGGAATGGTGGDGTGGAGTGGNGTGGNGTGGTPSVTNYIENDTFWKDTSGGTIYSQGGGVLQVGSTFYWYGVKYNGAVTYAANPTGKNGDIGFAGVTIYSSTDLVRWKHENTVKLTNTGGWFGRLGVVYNKNTKKYVLIAQGGGGLYFATSDTPTGNFVFNNVQTNLPGVVNGSTGDQTTFQDDDGKAYVIASSSSGRSHTYVIPLRSSDYLRAEQAVEIFKGKGREGNAMFKHEGRYYACSSDLHGWNTSQTYCISAANILGPYGAEFVMPNTEKDYSHVTQNGFYITVHGSEQQLVIYAGDRWSDFAGNGIGFNQWVPLDFDGTMPHFNSLSHWAPDVATGLWEVGPKNNYALNPSFEADRISVTQPVGWTATSSANAQGGHTGRWNWTLHGNAKLSQAATQLPNGSYTLSAWVKSTGGQSSAQLYATPSGGTQKATSVNTKINGWEQRSISGIQVTNGNCEIGVTTQGSDGQTVSIDDFTLIRNQ